MAKGGAAKRELIDTGNDKRYIRRNEKGQFDEVEDAGRSLSQDRKREARTTVKAGQGDKGDLEAIKSAMNKLSVAQELKSFTGQVTE